MPATKGIIMWVDTKLWDKGMLRTADGRVYRFPEFVYRAIRLLNPLIPAFISGLSRSTNLIKNPSTDPECEVCVYIPILPDAAHFRLAYEFIPPFPEDVRFCYKVIFNGRHVVSGDVTPRKQVRGNIAQAIEVECGSQTDKKVQYEAISFAFAGQNSCLFKSRADDGGLIEIRWYRIKGTKPCEPEELQPTKSFKSKYGINFQSTGPPATAKLRDILLIDPEDEPYAVFKFFYRSMQSLRDNSIVPEEYDEHTHEGTLIGDVTRGLLSFIPDGQLPRIATQSRLNPGFGTILEGVALGAHPHNSIVGLDVVTTIKGRLRGNSTSQTRNSAGYQDAPRRPSTSTTGGRRLDPLNGGQRRRSSSLIHPGNNTDRKSMMSPSPSLKVAIDREDDAGIDDVVVTAQPVPFQSLYVTKQRRRYTGGSHTEISGQVAALAVDDSDDDSMIADPSREERAATAARTLLSPPPVATGIYQHDITGLPHHGESDLSSLILGDHEKSSIIDEDFAASALAPPTMGVGIVTGSRTVISLDCFSPRRDNTGATAESPPIKTPGGHDFRVISPLATPQPNPTLMVIESSPTKTPGGHDFPVDPPGSDGFPVIEPGETFELSPGESGEGSVIDHTPPRFMPKSIKPSRSKKSLTTLLSPSFGFGCNFSLSSHHPSSPHEELEQPRPDLEGVVKRKVSQFECPRDPAPRDGRNSLSVPPARPVSPYFVYDDAGGEGAHARPGHGYGNGNFKASPSLSASQNTLGKARGVLASAKSRIGAIMMRDGANDADGDEVSGEKKAVDDLNDTFVVDTDDTILSSSPGKDVKRSSEKSKDKGKGKAKATEDDVFGPAASEATTHRRKPSSDDHPDHPLRRRQSLSKARYNEWLTPLAKSSCSNVRKDDVVPKMGSLAGDGRQDEQLAALAAPRSTEHILVGSAFVSSWNEADRHGNVTPNNDPPTAPASLYNFPVAAPAGPSTVAGNANPNANGPPAQVFDYASRVRAIPTPAEIVASDEERPAGFTADDESFFENAISALIEVANGAQNDGVAIRQSLERTLQTDLAGVNPAQGVQADRGAATGDLPSPLGMQPAAHEECQPNLLISSEDQADVQDGNVSMNGEDTGEQSDEQTDEQRRAQQIQQAIWDSTVQASTTSPAAEVSTSANPLNIGTPGHHVVQANQLFRTQSQLEERERRLTEMSRQLSFEGEYEQTVAIESLDRYAQRHAVSQVAAGGSAQHDQPSPATPHGAAAAPNHLPPRSSSLRHALRPTPNEPIFTPTRSALNGVPVSAVPAPAVRGIAPPVYAGAQPNPLRTLPRSPSIIERGHPLGSPMTRSPSVTFSGQDRRAAFSSTLTPATDAPSSTNVTAAGVRIREVSNAGNMFRNTRESSETYFPPPMPGAWMESPMKSEMGERGEEEVDAEEGK